MKKMDFFNPKNLKQALERITDCWAIIGFQGRRVSKTREKRIWNKIAPEKEFPKVVSFIVSNHYYDILGADERLFSVQADRENLKKEYGVDCSFDLSTGYVVEWPVFFLLEKGNDKILVITDNQHKEVVKKVLKAKSDFRFAIFVRAWNKRRVKMKGIVEYQIKGEKKVEEMGLPSKFDIRGWGNLDDTLEHEFNHILKDHPERG